MCFATQPASRVLGVKHVSNPGCNKKVLPTVSFTILRRDLRSAAVLWGIAYRDGRHLLDTKPHGGQLLADCALGQQQWCGDDHDGQVRLAPICVVRAWLVQRREDDS